jgi:hypothetical protein
LFFCSVILSGVFILYQDQIYPSINLALKGKALLFREPLRLYEH